MTWNKKHIKICTHIWIHVYTHPGEEAEENHTWAMIRPDGYFATEAKLSTANGWGPAYQVKNRI